MQSFQEDGLSLEENFTITLKIYSGSFSNLYHLAGLHCTCSQYNQLSLMPFSCVARSVLEVSN